MTFDRLHRVVTIATHLVAIAVLWLSGEFPIYAMVGASAAACAGPFTWRYGTASGIPRLVNVYALAAGIISLILAFQSGNYLYFAILFAVSLSVPRSLLLRRSGDFLQLYVLTFLLVVAGSVVNPGLSYGVLMLPYVVSLTLGLMLTNLRVAIEGRAGPEGQDDPDRMAALLARRDLLPAGFVSVTVGVTLVVFLASVLFFFLFPRLGLGFFAQQSRRGISMTGFSETVTLGDFGRIVEDPAVVMRVRDPAGAGLAVPLRMRGQSLDQYDGATWRKTTARRREMPMDGNDRFRTDLRLLHVPLEDLVPQEVYLEPMTGTPRVLFGEPIPIVFERPPDVLAALRPRKWRFYADATGDVSMTGPDAVSIVYTVYSQATVEDPNRMRGAGTDYPPLVDELYLQLPARLDARVADLARQVAGASTDPYDRAEAVRAFLTDGFTYSLDSAHDGPDPLADFLLDHREGHCEYFASGMVVLLRSLGIPARIVNGFYGGERNEYGDYVTLRKSDAHSWVEVYFPGQGWATFDPTPPAFLDLRADRSWLKSLSAALDAVQLAWYRWIVEYNLEKQMDFLGALVGFGGGGEGFSGNPWNLENIRGLGRRIGELPWGRALLGLVALLIAVGVVVRRLRRRVVRAALGGADDASVAAYRRMVRILRGARLSRGASETQLEFARRAGGALPEAAPDVLAVTRAYLDSAFGGTAAAAADPAAALERIARAVEAARKTGP